MADLIRNSTPLLTIEFEWTDWRDDPRFARDPDFAGITPDAPATIIRHWHHVPRTDDHVTLTEGDKTYDGNVRAVWWADDGNVTIKLS